MDYRFYVDSKLIGNWLCVIAWKTSDNALIKESNDWFYTIGEKHPDSLASRKKILNKFEIVKGLPIKKTISEECIFGVSTFYRGTGHGYAFIFQLIHQYAESNLKILLPVGTQQGMVDLCESVFGLNRIIRIEPDTIYEIPKLAFVQNKYHAFVPKSIMDSVVPRFLKPQPSLSLCVLKTSSTENVTKSGVLTELEVKNLNIPERFQLIDPSKMNECVYASMIYYAKELLVSWGTAHFKALEYLQCGNVCKNITILVVGPVFLKQYEKRMREITTIPTKYVIYDNTSSLRDI